MYSRFSRTFLNWRSCGDHWLIETLNLAGDRRDKSHTFKILNYLKRFLFYWCKISNFLISLSGASQKYENERFLTTYLTQIYYVSSFLIYLSISNFYFENRWLICSVNIFLKYKYSFNEKNWNVLLFMLTYLTILNFRGKSYVAYIFLRILILDLRELSGQTLKDMHTTHTKITSIVLPVELATRITVWCPTSGSKLLLQKLSHQRRGYHCEKQKEAQSVNKLSCLPCISFSFFNILFLHQSAVWILQKPSQMCDIFLKGTFPRYFHQ